jgi:hypothetical protein
MNKVFMTTTNKFVKLTVMKSLKTVLVNVRAGAGMVSSMVEVPVAGSSVVAVYSLKLGEFRGSSFPWTVILFERYHE